MAPGYMYWLSWSGGAEGLHVDVTGYFTSAMNVLISYGAWVLNGADRACHDGSCQPSQCDVIRMRSHLSSGEHYCRNHLANTILYIWEHSVVYGFRHCAGYVASFISTHLLQLSCVLAAPSSQYLSTTAQ
jgi:hypothetical protein